MTKPDELDDELDQLEPEAVTTKGPKDAGLDGDQDELDDQALSLFAKTTQPQIRTRKAATEWGRDQLTSKSTGWSGLCWKFARSCVNAPALAPSAIAGWHMAGPEGQHRCKPDAAPRGYAGLFSGGEFGHAVWLLGGDRCLSNDTRGDTQIHVATITGIEKAWGYKFLGYVTKVNGYDAPVVAKAPRPSWRLSRKWKLAQLRAARDQARSSGNLVRAKRLQRWINQLVER